MRRIVLLVAAIALGAPPALADCPYAAFDRTLLEFVEDGENTVIIQHPDGRTEICHWARTDEGTGSALQCDSQLEAEYFKRAEDGRNLAFRGLNWWPDCPENSVPADDAFARRDLTALTWSSTSVPPFPYDAENASGYPLREPLDGWSITRTEQLRAWLISPAVDVDFTVWLISRQRQGDWQQLVEMWMNAGPDSYRILSLPLEGLPYDKLAAQGDRLLGKITNSTARVDLDWQALAKPWVEANYRSPRAWRGVLDGSGPVPWDEVIAALDQWDRLNMQCRGGPGDAPETQKACAERDDLYGVITEAYGLCYGTMDQPSAEYEWHRCGAGSNP